jgi:hypothetical protein
MLKPAIDRPSRKRRTAIVARNVAVDYLEKAGGRATKNRQVVETKWQTSWGIYPRSTEPKAVSGLRRKYPIFNYLYFKEMARLCCNLWSFVEPGGSRQLRFYLQSDFRTMPVGPVFQLFL